MSGKRVSAKCGIRHRGDSSIKGRSRKPHPAPPSDILLAITIGLLLTALSVRAYLHVAITLNCFPAPASSVPCGTMDGEFRLAGKAFIDPHNFIHSSADTQEHECGSTVLRD